MKHQVLFLLLIALPLVAWGDHVTMPLPACCYPLNGGSMQEIMSGQKTGVQAAGTVALADRFGDGEGACCRPKDVVPMVWTVPDGKDGHTGATLTFWMYAGKDSLSQAFWAKDERGQTVQGFSKAGRRAVLEMYHKGRAGELTPDRQWLWSDSNFDEGEGWYFVAIVYAEDGTRVYFTTPAGRMTETYSAFTPEREAVASWGIGSADTGWPCSGVDDFKVYTAALDCRQVQALYEAESRLPLGTNAWNNKETHRRLLLAEWYGHCVGKDGGELLLALQRDVDGSFLCMDEQNGITLLPALQPDNGVWTLTPAEDGACFYISNVSAGSYLGERDGLPVSDVLEHKDCQMWYLDNIPTGQYRKNGFAAASSPVGNAVYYDRQERAIKVKLSCQQPDDLRIVLYHSDGRVLTSKSFEDVQAVDHSFALSEAGVYLVAILSDNNPINEKIVVKF